MSAHLQIYRQIEKRLRKKADVTSASGHSVIARLSDSVDSAAAKAIVFPSQPQALSFFDSRLLSSARPRVDEVADRERSLGGEAEFAQVGCGGSLQGHVMRPCETCPASSGHGLIGRRDDDIERALVGSLQSGFPFTPDGLCKKTISIQVGDSSQHLVSYYKVDDVRNGRLRTPQSLPEIAGLQISPSLLRRSNFRNPLDIGVLPNGNLQSCGDETEASRGAAVGVGSGSVGTSDSEVTLDRDCGMGDLGCGLGNGFTASALSALRRQPVLPDVNFDAGHVPQSKCNVDLPTHGASARRLSGSLARKSWSMSPSGSMTNPIQPRSSSGPRRHGYIGQLHGLDVNDPTTVVRHRAAFSDESSSGATDPLLCRATDDPIILASQWPHQAHINFLQSSHEGNTKLWAFASGHTVRPASSPSTSASDTTTRPWEAMTGTWQLPLHASGIDTDFGSNGVRSARYLRKTAARGASGDSGATNVLSLQRAPVDTSLHYDSHSPAGLPVVLDSKPDLISQDIGRSAALDQLASSVSLQGGPRPEDERQWQYSSQCVDPDLLDSSSSGLSSDDSGMGPPAAHTSENFAAQPDGLWLPFPELHYLLHAT